MAFRNINCVLDCVQFSGNQMLTKILLQRLPMPSTFPVKTAYKAGLLCSSHAQGGNHKFALFSWPMLTGRITWLYYFGWAMLTNSEIHIMLHYFAMVQVGMKKSLFAPYSNLTNKKQQTRSWPSLCQNWYIAWVHRTKTCQNLCCLYVSLEQQFTVQQEQVCVFKVLNCKKLMWLS